MHKVIIDLNGLKTQSEIMQKFGEILEFGGPDGNIDVDLGTHKGWGLNWNALNDSLKYLEIGGIWGTARKFQFPLKLLILNSSLFKQTDLEGFKILMEILTDTFAFYKTQSKIFEFEISQV